MRTNFDFAPYRRSTVGFDRLFDLLETGMRGDGSSRANVVEKTKSPAPMPAQVAAHDGSVLWATLRALVEPKL